MILAAHQTNYLPNLGFFYKMARADQFVLISNLQFEKQEGWQRRHKIKTTQGDHWLTVPIYGSQYQKLKEVKVNNEIDWRKKHKRTIEVAYAKSKERNLLPEITALYEKPWERLTDLNVAFITLFKNVLNIKTPIVFDEEVSGEKHRLIINICKKYHADTFLSGVGSLEYMSEAYLNELSENGITHTLVQKNLTASYPYSAIHYIMTEGRDAVLRLLETS